LSEEKKSRAQILDKKLISLFDDEEFRRIDQAIGRHQSEIKKKRFLLENGARLDRWVNRIIAQSMSRNVRAIKTLERERRERITTLVNDLTETGLKDIFKKDMRRCSVVELHQSME
jgi:hypothetical protein